MIGAPGPKLSGATFRAAANGDIEPTVDERPGLSSILRGPTPHPVAGAAIASLVEQGEQLPSWAADIIQRTFDTGQPHAGCPDRLVHLPAMPLPVYRPTRRARIRCWVRWHWGNLRGRLLP